MDEPTPSSGRQKRPRVAEEKRKRAVRAYVHVPCVWPLIGTYLEQGTKRTIQMRLVSKSKGEM